MKTVLVAPLDWGLGHTSRCVPIISELKKQNAKVIFAGNSFQIEFIKKHFEGIDYEYLQGYDVSYSAIWPQWIKVGFQSLRLTKIVEKENKWLEEFIKKNPIDSIISDNRYGFYNKKVKSIFITHQLNIPSPLFKSKINSINNDHIKNFDECWIPDDPDINLSGELSKSDGNHRYVGLLSRFNASKKSSFKKFDLCFLLSGPEPQREILENLLLQIFSNSGLKIALIRGCMGKIETSDTVKAFEVLETENLLDVLTSCEHIICRSGYSSLMDLACLNKKMFLIPTPGQPEQEYIAQYLKQEFGIPFEEQKKISNSKNILNLHSYKSLNVNPSNHLLQKEISRILMD